MTKPKIIVLFFSGLFLAMIAAAWMGSVESNEIYLASLLSFVAGGVVCITEELYKDLS